MTEQWSAAPPPPPPPPGAPGPVAPPPSPSAADATAQHPRPDAAAGGGPTLAPWGWLQIAVVIVVPLAVFIEDGGTSLWDGAEAWAVFAVVCALVQFAPLVRNNFNWNDERAWSIGAVGVAGLVLYWVLIVLPVIAQNAGFALTLATAAACGGAYLAPGKRV